MGIGNLAASRLVRGVHATYRNGGHVGSLATSAFGGLWMNVQSFG